jgi:hypothetical protein
MPSVPPATSFVLQVGGCGCRVSLESRTWVVGRVGRLWSQLAPHRSASEIAGVAVDAVRSRRELIIENAILRHQVNVLRRRSKRPMLHLLQRQPKTDPLRGGIVTQLTA